MTEVRELTETITAGPAQAVAGLLSVRPPDLGAGEGLPLLWHWFYLLERPPQSVLGPDGHPASGTLPVPPAPGLHRLFAGGRVSRYGPLRTGTEATRRTWQASSVRKAGRSGPLHFVTVRTEIVQGGQVVIAEEQDLVYREPGQATVGPPRAATAARRPAGASEWPVEVDPVLLFRFSALTYNAHRIHYDRDYARSVEGHPGLVVHGPLQALLMSELARRVAMLPEQCDYSYRLTAPLFEGQGLIVSATADTRSDSVAMTARDATDRTTASGVIRRNPLFERLVSRRTQARLAELGLDSSPDPAAYASATVSYRCAVIAPWHAEVPRRCARVHAEGDPASAQQFVIGLRHAHRAPESGAPAEPRRSRQQPSAPPALR